ncbi:uncharacterized protein BDZ99DRAFT_544078 [Mytilinidion resinicola]|uniref:Zn(2)-C6 fungal-type domain-containing protein n=1 Tax=Mytilinidion resinicola TaxID=574789 RepID=A0A6A6Y8X1_9PEZI|nr:uncharacterized protein BDZ99DRAFT_544078 [Mytilinidion resinicola]KAF2804998.1 hypothetical protein BDZ99DRAFT_544078 [Mytilinidion resinicola]
MDHEESQSDSSRPAKRARTLACKRCRHRKQKCDESRPCRNCRKSGEECVATEPAPRGHAEGEYIRALEERIAELEALDPQQSLDHIQRRSSLLNNARAQLADHQSRPSASTLERPESNGIAGPAPSEVVSESPGDFHAAVSPASTARSAANTRVSNMSNEAQLRHVSNLGLDDDSDLDHLILGLVTSPAALVAQLPLEVEELLLDAYHERAQAQYPFFHWDTFLFWHSTWKTCPPSDYGRQAWKGFFVNMVYATALLLIPRVGKFDSQIFYRQGVTLLPSVLRQGDHILQIQAYLVMAMHALHRSSTDRIMSLSSTVIRYCVQAQFHLAEMEPEPINATIHLENQLRRRTFWCAYKLDRLAAFSFDLPPSIPDSTITTKVYANVEDSDLLQLAAATPVDVDIPDSLGYTCVSPSLHIIQCRRIQSEILGFTLHWNYATQFESSPEWRIRILTELNNWKSQVQTFSDSRSKGYTSQRWLAMIYHYTLVMLYRPTKQNVIGPAGDFAVQASSQACLMFRKTQMDRQIAQPWLGLLVQFQAGITLLYCFWATPPQYRTENYDSPDVSDALRACSNILAIMADRWPKADCLRDVFELLAREIPLVDRPSRPPVRISDKSATKLRQALPDVRRLIVHRIVMRMIEEMIEDDFPRPKSTPLQTVSSIPGPRESAMRESIMPTPQLSRPPPSPPPTHMTFEMPFSAPQFYSIDGANAFDAEMPSFPGIFDYDSWT